jgi:hypothetical protein
LNRPLNWRSRRLFVTTKHRAERHPRRDHRVKQPEPGGAYHAHAVLAPTVTATGIVRIIAFQDQGLFGSFGLPQEYRRVPPRLRSLSRPPVLRPG